MIPAHQLLRLAKDLLPVSCVGLERPGRWRAVGVAAVFAVAALPAVPLFWQSLAGPGAFFIGAAFRSAFWNSALVAFLVAVVSLVLGLPVGVLTALYEFPGRKAVLMLATLPLLVPTFLWAIGWSALAARLGPIATQAIAGVGGCVLVFLASVFPLVLLTAYAAAAALTGSQVDAARLAGGEKALFRHACRYVALPACLAAGLGGVLTLSDPGPGQILGLRTAASEILTSFAALNDFPLAGRQCTVLAVLVLVLVAPLVGLVAPRLATEMMARQVRGFRPRSMAEGIGAALLLLVFLGTLAPVAGLTLPLLGGTEFARTWREIRRTGANTLVYAVGAGAIATALGLALAFCVGRSRRLRTISLALCLMLFALPPALGALGIIQVAAEAPAWTRPVLRSRLTVCLALGLRFFPVAAVLGLRAWGSMPASWALAAGIHGVPLGSYLRKVVVPFLLPAGAVIVLLVALLATAEIGTVLLVHPPGEASLPLAIFTVMANAPQSLVASLCLAYLAGAAGLLAAAWGLPRRRAL